MKFSVISFIILFLLLGCSTSRFIPTGLNTEKRAPLPIDTKFYVLNELPKESKKIEEIGNCYCSVPGGGMITDNTHKAVAKLKTCALKSGGNAILLKDTKEKGYSTGFGYSQQTARAEAIVYYIEL